MGTNYIAPIWRMPRNANKDNLSNYSINFNGTTDYIEISDNILSGLESFSISVWYNARTLPISSSAPFYDKAILGSWSSVTPQMLLYWDDPDGWRFLMTDGSSVDIIWGTATTTNEWHHIVVTYDGATLKFYHDNGTPVTKAVVKGPIQARTSAWRIGVDTSSTRYWDGELSQFCLFDYALSTDQVDDLYNLENPMIIDGGEPIQYLPLGDNSNPNAPGSFPNISVGADSVFDFVPNDYIEIPDSDLLSFGDSVNDFPFSISGWFYFDATGSYGLVAKYGTTSTSREWMLYTTGSNFRLLLYDTNNNNAYADASSTTIVTNKWYHVVATYNGAGGVPDAREGIQIYINGQPATMTRAGGASYVAMHNTGRRVDLGSRSNTSYFDGQMSNVQIWDVELSATNALELYNNGQPLMTGTQPQEANLLAWWKLNQSANYEQGIGPWDIQIVGTPNYSGTADGCYTTGTALRYADTGDQITGSGNYFRWLTPLISCQGTIDITHTLGGEYVTASSGVQLTFQYSLDGGGWVTYHNELVSSSASTTPVTFTITSATGLSCNNNIRVRVLGAGGLFNASYIEFYNIKIAGGTRTFYEQDFSNYSSLIGYNNGNVFNQSQVGNYIDPVWQIPDNRSAYPQSFDFDGSSQRVKPGTTVSLGITDAITVSAWVRIPTTNTGGPSPNIQEIICEDAAGGSNRNWGLNWRGGTYNYFGFTVWHTDNTSTSVFSSGIVPNDGKWHHVIGTFDGTTNANGLKLYVDNTLFQNTANGAGVRSTFGVHPSIGSLENGTTWMFEGNISNVYVWETDLNSTQVETLYNNGVPSTSAVDTDNLKLWYKLDNTELFDGTNWIIQNQKTPANYESALYFTGGAGNEHLETPSNSDLLMAGSHSFSVWLNVDFAQVDSTNYIFDKGGLDYSLGFSGTALRLIYYNYYDSNGPSGNNKVITLDSIWKTKYDSGWNHVVVSVDQPNLTITVTTNGTDTTVITTPPPGTPPGNWLPEDYVSPDQGSGNLNIMSFNGVTLSLAGYISNLAFYNGTALTTAEALTLYNNGTPENNISFSPTSWWKIDNTSTGLLDNAGSANLTNTGGVELDTYVTVLSGISSGMTEQNLVNNNVSVLNGESVDMNSTNLVTSNLTRTQPYSNYSFNFDATITDYITVPSPGSIFAYGENAFTFSGWVSIDAYTDQDGIFARYGDTNNRVVIKLTFASPGYDGIMFQTMKAGVNGYVRWPGILPTPADGEWKHICLTYASGTLKLYLDGADQGAGVLTGTIANPMPDLSSFNAPLDIANDRHSANRFLNGRTSNFCVFDRALTEDEILNIYNNGVTQDLQAASSFSNNILGWWPMDQRSSYYDGTDWVVRDLEGGKDGNGINTGNVEDMVGNAPGSDANGSGVSLAIENLIGDMKDSKLNAYSINMADYADGVTNPADSGRSTEIPTVP